MHFETAIYLNCRCQREFSFESDHVGWGRDERERGSL